MNQSPQFMYMKKTTLHLSTVVILLTTVAFANNINAQSKAERAQSGISKEIVSEQDYEKGKPVGKEKIENEFIYDAQGRLTTEIEYNAGKPDNTITMVYDAEGKKTKEIVKNQAGKITKTIEYKYVNGLRTERITYDADGIIKTKKLYKYEKTQ
jgi:YD repeat-containing protein